MAGQYSVLSKSADAVAKRLGRAAIGVVLGSGLSEALDSLDRPRFMEWADIPGMPAATTEGHRGTLLYGRCGDVPVLAQCGRVHMYEDRANSEVAAPIRLLSLLGVHTLIVTSAVGSTAEDSPPGTMVLIEDHINLAGRNVLSGEHDARFGPRFPDMSANYDREIGTILTETAEVAGLPMTKGLLVHTLGPSYETPAEVTLAKSLGARVVSMSMAPDVLVAKQRGMRLAGIGCVTNFASGISSGSLGHDEVQQQGAVFASVLKDLLAGSIPRLARTTRA